MVKNTLLDFTLVKYSYYGQMQTERLPEQLVEDWIRSRQKLSSIPNPEIKKIDVYKEIRILDVALTEIFEFGNALNHETTESQQMELGDVAFSLMATGTIRKYGVIDIDSNTKNIKAHELKELMENSVSEARIIIDHENIKRNNRKNIQKYLSAPIQAAKEFCASNNWNFEQILTNVYEKNTLNYIEYYFIYGSPFQNVHNSLQFLKLMRKQNRIQEIVLNHTIGLNQNSLWFISGHSDQNIIRDITKQELLNILNTENSNADDIDVITAQKLFEIADFTPI